MASTIDTRGQKTRTDHELHTPDNLACYLQATCFPFLSPLTEPESAL